MKDITINPQLVANVIHSLGMYVADLEYHSNHRSINDINQDNNSRQWDSIDELKCFISGLKDDINRLKDEVNCHDIASDQSPDMEMSGASCCALNEIDQVMSKWFSETEWHVEWRSVLGEDHWENPIWSLTFYVETQDSRKKLEKDTYRAHVAVYHSFSVEASSEEEARRIASEEVNWSHHVTDSEIVVEMETGGSEDD